MKRKIKNSNKIIFIYLQDLLTNNKICHIMDEDPNAKPFADTSSHDLKILNVFKDILIHRLYIKNSYELGK